ncbi:MAG: ABC transporter substrate-binding protein [Chloroflexota bacterium]
MSQKRFRPAIGILLTVMSVLALAAAGCGGEEEPTATPAPDPTNTPAADPTDEPATATPDPSDTPTEEPAPGDGPSGTLVAALESVGVPIGTPELCVPNCANEKYFYSAWDTLLQWTADDEVGPGVAESWELADDLSSFTWHIREGIEFHKGWGELTAEDVAFSTNNVNSNTNPDTVHDVSGDMSCCYGETTVVDTYTARTEILNYDSRAPGWLFTNLRDSYGISSKAVYDEHGAEGMREIFVGTGPFEVQEWTEGDRVILEALPEHYRNTAGVQTVRILEVPEEASRIAMFESADTDITHVTLPNVERLENAGGTKRLLETSILHIGFAPNFLEKTNPKTGEPLDNPGFDPSLPWVTDPFADGCDWDVLLEVVPEEPACDEMENPRKVRLAMSMAINREALTEGLLEDLGWPAGNWAISAKSEHHKDEWMVPYDPEEARQLMEEAGHEDGFEVGMWVGEEPSELHQAITSMWQDELGIETEFHTGPFSVWQERFVDRSLQQLVIDGEQGGMPVHYPKAREAQAWFAGGIMWSGGIPFYQQIYGDMLAEPDEQARIEMASEFGDHERYWNWDPGVWEEPIYTIYAGERMEWNPQSNSIHTQVPNYVYPLEDITLR